MMKNVFLLLKLKTVIYLKYFCENHIFSRFLDEEKVQKNIYLTYKTFVTV